MALPPASSGQRNADRHAAGTIGVSLWRRTMSIITDMHSAMPKASRSPNRRPSCTAPPIMTMMPNNATKLASNVAQLSRMRYHSQPSPAVMNGAAAKMITTSATDVLRRALMNRNVANVERECRHDPGPADGAYCLHGVAPLLHDDDREDEYAAADPAPKQYRPWVKRNQPREEAGRTVGHRRKCDKQNALAMPVHSHIPLPS